MKINLLLSESYNGVTAWLNNYAVISANKNKNVLYINTCLDFKGIVSQFYAYGLKNNTKINLQTILDFSQVDDILKWDIIKYDVIIINSPSLASSSNKLNNFLIPFINRYNNNNCQIVIYKQVKVNEIVFDENNQLFSKTFNIDNTIMFLSILKKYIDSITYIEYGSNDGYTEIKVDPITYLKISDDNILLPNIDISMHGYNLEYDPEFMVKDKDNKKDDNDDTIKLLNILKYEYNIEYDHKCIVKDNKNDEVLEFDNDSKIVNEFIKNYNSCKYGRDQEQYKSFNWKEQLEINRNTVFPSRFIEEACSLIIKQQEEIEKINIILKKYRL